MRPIVRTCLISIGVFVFSTYMLMPHCNATNSGSNTSEVSKIGEEMCKLFDDFQNLGSKERLSEKGQEISKGYENLAKELWEYVSSIKMAAHNDEKENVINFFEHQLPPDPSYNNLIKRLLKSAEFEANTPTDRLVYIGEDLRF